MVSHIEQMQALLQTNTSLTIVVYPAEALEGYTIYPNPAKFARKSNLYTEWYTILIRVTSLTNLETAIEKFLKADSSYPSGYHYSTSTYPLWVTSELVSKPFDNQSYQAVIELSGSWSF